MRSTWLLPLALVLWSTASEADSTPICAALSNLKTEARRSGPQRITVYKQEPMVFACGRTEGASVQDAFCKAALPAVGIEFTHIFPWLIHDCLVATHVQSGMEAVKQYTGIKGRDKITHLWAKWDDGTYLDIRFHAEGDFGPQPELRDYWGRYELVAWAPRRPLSTLSESAAHDPLRT